ncbi:MAG TPA: nuclear transport factor 2 family protein [Cellulomonas sp.]
MDRTAVMAWVAAYERLWRADDPDPLDTIFTEDVRYLRSPYAEPLDGLAAVRAFWRDPTPFTMTAEPVAVEGSEAVVRLEVRYGGDEPQDYRDLWVLRFAPDGRVRHFEEWPTWPGFTETPSDGSAAG